MKPKIVVPTDFSESSLKGLDFAVQVAQKIGAKVILHHIVEGFQDTRMYGNTEPTSEQKLMMSLMTAAAYKKMGEIVQEYQNTGVEIECSVEVGTVYASIEEKIAKEDADLIVVGTRGHSKLDKKHLGSNSYKIIRNSKHPVLVVEGRVQLEEIETILFASEFGEEPDKVINELNDWQTITGAKIILLKVNHPNFTMSHKDIHEALQEFATQKKLHNYEIAIYTDIDPAHGIIHFAEREKVGLIFVGTDFYRSLWERLWHRRTQVAEEVATHTAIPVLSYQPE